jgi:N-acetylmuramoyl-L-alanine amidase
VYKKQKYFGCACPVFFAGAMPRWDIGISTQRRKSVKYNGRRYLMKRLIVFLFLLVTVLTGTLFAQTSRVLIEGRDEKPLIATFTEHSIVYGSMRDVANALDLGFYYAEQTRKIELKTPRFRLKATGDNPFVVVNDIASGAEAVYQLPVNVIIADNDLFVPLNDFARFLDIVLPADVSFEWDDRELVVGEYRADHYVDISGMEVEERKNGYLIRLKGNRPVKDFSGFYREDGWFYLTVVGAHVDIDAFKNFRPVTPVRRVIPEQTPTSFQLSIQLNREVHSTDIFRDPQSDDIIIALHKRVDPTELAQTHWHASPEHAIARDRDRWKLDVIVIDPGHGGKDPGTIGVRGTREKDVTLAISKKLGELISKHMPETKIVFTRETDEFVELYRRGQIANEAGGKLFISIHANSTRRKPAPQRGFEIYLLRPGRTEEAIRIAERENSVIRFEEDHEERYAHLTDENFILVSMAHSAYIRYSEQFADILQNKFTENTNVNNRGVRQAGFYVLVGASMPGVLVEVGYLSNADEERFLTSAQGQQQIAEAIFKAVQRYSNDYETMFDTAAGL